MSLMTLAAKISLDSQEFNTGLKNAADTFKTGLGNAAKIGAKAIGVATAAAGAFGLSALKVGGEFDSAMSQVQATLGYTTEDIANNVNGAADAIEALRAKAKEMGASTNFSASQAAEGLNILAMSGYDAKQSMDMIEDVLHLAAAGSMDMASAAAYVSGTMKGFADETKNAGYYADLMAKGATLANTNVSQLGEAMSSGAAGAAAYNQSADSMTIALLRLAEQGEAGSAAGTALSAAMKNLYTPTAQASKAMQELGVSAYDSNGNYRDFNEVVNELDASLNSLGSDGLPKYTQEQIAAYKQTIFGIQGLDAYNKMTVTSTETQEKWAAELAKASDGAGEAAKQYNTMTDNLQGDIDIWNSALDGFKIAVSEKFMPATRNIVKFGSSAISELTAAFENGGIEGAVQKLGDLFQNALQRLTEALPQAIKVGTSLVANIIAGIVGAIPSLVSVLPDIAVAIYDGIADVVPMLMESGKALFDMLMTGLREQFPNMIPTIMEMLVQFTANLRETAGTLVDAGLEMIMAIADGIISNLPTLIRTVPTIVSNIANVINDNMPKIITAGITIIAKLIVGIVKSVPTLIAEFPKMVKAAANVLTAFNWLNLGRTIITLLKNGISAILSGIPGTFSKMVSGAWKALKGVDWGGLGRTVINLLKNGIQSILSNIPSLLSKAGRSAFSAFKNVNWLSLGVNVISGIASGISRGVGRIADAAKNAAKRALNAAKNFLGIKSPSRVFRDQVGKMMAEGMAIGFEENIPDMDLQAALDNTIDNLSVASPVVPGQSGNGNIVIEIPLMLEDGGLREIARASVMYTADELERLKRNQNRGFGIVGA